MISRGLYLSLHSWKWQKQPEGRELQSAHGLRGWAIVEGHMAGAALQQAACEAAAPYILVDQKAELVRARKAGPRCNRQRLLSSPHTPGKPPPSSPNMPPSLPAIQLLCLWSTFQPQTTIAQVNKNSVLARLKNVDLLGKNLSFLETSVSHLEHSPWCPMKSVWLCSRNSN